MMIRQQQMQSFEDYMQAQFEDRMVEHLRRFFPQTCQRLGEEGTRHAVREGIDAAGQHGITARCDVCTYIDIMFTFGRHFDSDPALPWAGHLLYEECIVDVTELVERLHAAALQHAAEARGLDV